MELKRLRVRACSCFAGVLIVPFMELKLAGGNAEEIAAASLNRTFYGIETLSPARRWRSFSVLIVPFMELKPRCV